MGMDEDKAACERAHRKLAECEELRERATKVVNELHENVAELARMLEEIR